MAGTDDTLRLALDHHRAGRLAEADRLYREILHAERTHPDALHGLGIVAAQAGKLEPSAQLITNALSIAPGRGEYHASLGNVFMAGEKYAEASERYQRALFYSYFKEIPPPFASILDHVAARLAGKSQPVANAADLDLFKSQTAQDLFLDRWVFHGLERGTFIDIGAHDGVTYSNTWFFEKARHWQGVCVEANPAVAKRLAANRSCRIMQACVAGAPGRVEFLKLSGYSEMLSGIVGAYDPDHKKRVEDELRQYGGSSEVISVEARTFDEIVETCGYSEITYVNIDTEGSEQAILDSIRFNRAFIHALTVECNYQVGRDAMLGLMDRNGFELIKAIGSDLLFLNRASSFFPAYDALRKA
jgi:FkbM family methyltransferase